MIADAIKYIATLAAEAAKPIEIAGLDPRVKTFAVNGKIESRAIEPSPRNHSVDQIEDIIRLANRFDGEEGCSPVVWYDEDAVVLVIDDAENRLDQARFDLKTSNVFDKIRELREDKTYYSQKDFVRLLRIELAGTLQPGILLDRVRKIRWETTDARTGEVTRNRESLGREINAKVDSTADIPEEVVLEAPVYSSRGERALYGFHCSVEVEPLNQTFRLMPLPDEIERVQQLAVQSIGERLAESLNEGIPAYYGNP